MAEHRRAVQRREKSERAAQEGRAFAAGNRQIKERAHAGAQQRGWLAHEIGNARLVVDINERGYQQRCGDNGQQLLEGVNKILTDRGLFMDVVYELHNVSSMPFDQPARPVAAQKTPCPGRTRRAKTSSSQPSWPHGTRLKGTQLRLSGSILPQWVRIVKTLFVLFRQGD